MNFLVYELTSEALYLGERAKGNVFKPCLRTIPYSAISGALRSGFGRADNLHQINAIGFLEEGTGRNRVEFLTYGPRDRASGISKIPLQIEFLADVRASILIVETEAAVKLPRSFQICLGGMRSHGFGIARLQFRGLVSEGQPRIGVLRVRLPEEELGNFGIRKVLRPVYGYLFKPAQQSGGIYVRSLFEGSRVVAPDALLQPDGGQFRG